ncbi:MAG: 50S ribosomal protein L18 [Ignavibacteria bacterium]|nr:50S ribosomal protein L18 [Ignavibacteria bacterium]
MITKRRKEQRDRLKRHIRMRITGTPEKPRLAVFRSLKHVYVQLIDDSSGKTLLSVSDLSKEFKEEFKDVKGQIEKGKKVGLVAARKALEKDVKNVVFDRGGYLYHGAVKAVADGAREGGLRF